MGKVVEIEAEDELGEILSSAGSKLVVVDFWAQWCGPCRVVGPYYHKMAEESQYEGVVLFYSIDVDDVGELAEQYEIQVMPTFIFFKDGEKVDEMSGANKDKLRELVEKYK